MERIDAELLEIQKSTDPVHIKIEGLKSEPIEIDVPQRFMELDMEQVCSLGQLLMAQNKQGGFLIQFVADLLKLTPHQMNDLGLEFVKDFQPLANPFLKKNQLSAKIVVTDVPYDGKTLKGPMNELSDLVLDEFIYMEMMKEAFLKNKKQKAIDSFCAVYFRDRRKTFESFTHNLKLAEKETEHLPHKYKVGALTNYMAITNVFPKRFPFVYSNTGGNSGDPIKWRELIVKLAGPSFGVPNQVRESLLLDVLTELNDRLKSKK